MDPQTPSFDPSPLIPYLERLGVKLHYISSPIIEQAKTSMQGDSLCAFCARYDMYLCLVIAIVVFRDRSLFVRAP